MSEEIIYRLSVGYRNSSDVEALRDALTNTDIKLVSYDQDAQRVFDNAIRLDADVVLITPECTGYRTAILQDLLFQRAKPVPVIGWVEARSDDGRQMMSHGAAGYITLPLDEIQISNFINTVHEVVERERKRRTQADAAPAVARETAAVARPQMWQSKVIAVYVPKGGGSHRTTTAVNLSVVLSQMPMKKETGGSMRILLRYLSRKHGRCILKTKNFVLTLTTWFMLLTALPLTYV